MIISLTRYKLRETGVQSRHAHPDLTFYSPSAHTNQQEDNGNCCNCQAKFNCFGLQHYNQELHSHEKEVHSMSACNMPAS